MELEIEISVPRLAHKQNHRNNPPSDNSTEYWQHSLIIPYLDSATSSLNIKFSQENTLAFTITDLHTNAELFTNFYELDDIAGELGTTATVERSFGMLRRVKTWLRSTMGEERLTGLCLMSVHLNFAKENREMVEKNVIDKFLANPRRLLLT
ncbi:hypothetical protein PR048_004984 [Dryococelus australis]|uniref:HAT C-terminal dimerisation domain-containing protein n=1 Tax=Dryococelus australis TaxID=614101 RepID=A0ABQ9I7Y9_9NEOP|nr:hypothetical protein PR048_004984 [Dryococelus australis]